MAEEGASPLAAIEGPWYAFVDWLESKGVPARSATDKIDQKVPSALIALLIWLLLLAFLLYGLVFAGWFGFFGGSATITLTVTSNGAPLQGVAVTVAGLEGTTGEDGTTTLTLPRGWQTLELSREQCTNRSIKFEVKRDENRSVTMDCLAGALGGCLELPPTLESARVVGEDNAEPSNCALVAATADGGEVDTGWVIDSENRLFFSTERCVRGDHEIFIQCDRHSRQGGAEEIVREAETTGEVVVYASGAAKRGLEAGALYNVYVTVEDEDGQPIGNVRVIAVDSLGNEYITGYRNTQTSDVTNADGQAVLTMADGLEFVVRAEDPNGKYAPAVSSLLKATEAIEVKLTMADGLASTITVSSNGEGISGAPVAVKRGGVTLIKAKTDPAGSYTTTLEKGSYVAESAPAGYYPGKASFDAGKDAAIELQALAEGEAGIIKIAAVAPDEVPLKDVRVLLEYDGITAGDCITGDSGKCVFEGMAPGTYVVLAVAPATPDPQEFGELALEKGGVAEKTIVVQPKGFTLTARTKTLTAFISASVSMLSRTSGKEIAKKDSDAGGKAEFGAYLGQSVYLEGNAKNYPQATSGTIIIVGDSEAVLLFAKADDFEECGADCAGWVDVPGGGKVTLVAPASIALGGTAKATVRAVGDAKFTKATIELWSGEEGSKENPLKTPVELGEVTAKPGATVKTSDSYEGGEPSGTGAAKYMRYSAPGASQSLDIPLVAKQETDAKATALHYRVRWESDAGESADSGWLEKEIAISGGAEWRELVNAYFSSYKAGFGAENAPESEWAKSTVLMPGSDVYVHILAVPAKSVRGFRAEMDSKPPFVGEKHLLPVEYKLEGKTTVLEQKLPQVIVSQASLEEGEPVHLVVRMRATTAVDNAVLMLFNDPKGALTFTIDGSQGANPEVETPIPDVTAVVVAKARVCPPPGYEGDCGWGSFSGLLGSLSKEGGREIAVGLEFRNHGEAGQDIALAVEAPGIEELNYEPVASVQAGGSKTITITGVGAAAGEISISLDGQQWQTIRHGVVDYSIDVMGDAGPLTTQSAEVRVKPLRNGALMADAQAFAEGKALVKKGTDYFTSEGIEIELGRTAAIEVKHRELVSLRKNEPVRGIFFDPEERDYSKPTLRIDDYNPEINKKIVTVLNLNTEPASITLSPTFDDEFLNLGVNVAVFDADGNGTAGSTIPANGKAEVYFNASAKSAECNKHVSNSSVRVSASAPGISRVATYFVEVGCSLGEGGGAGEYVVFRESGEMMRHSCALVGNTAYLCDAEQLSTAILKAAENLHLANKTVEKHTYAFGNDFVNPKVVAEAAKLAGLSYPGTIGGAGEQSDNALIVPEIKCGIIDAVLTKAAKGRTVLSVTKRDAPWCSAASAYYFAGALNSDPGIATMKSYVKAAAAATDSEKDSFLGIALPADDEAVFTVAYRGFQKSDLLSLPFNRYGWLTAKSSALYDDTGYYNVVPVREGADIFAGTVGAANPCFLANLEQWWTTGANDYISGSVRGGIVLADLSKCVAPPAVNVPDVALRLDDSKGTDVHVTSDAKITAVVASAGSACKLVMEDKTGNELQAWEGASSQEVTLPAEDYVFFKASCKDTGYAKWATSYLVKDSEPPGITLPTLTATNKPGLVFTANATDNYGVESCELKIANVTVGANQISFPATPCPHGAGDSYLCDSKTDFKTQLPQDRYTLLSFRVNCTDVNLNEGSASGSVYYYPTDVPLISVNTTKTNAVLSAPYYYSKVTPLDVYVDASSETGITGCVVKDTAVPPKIRDCSLVACNNLTQDKRCLNGQYKCAGMVFTHEGHYADVEVTCSEAKAEEEGEQKTMLPIKFVYDKKAPTIVSVVAEPYNVTNCTMTNIPTLWITLSDTWFDDEELTTGKTNCTAYVWMNSGPNMTLAKGAGMFSTYQAGPHGPFTASGTCAGGKCAIDMRGVRGVGWDGKGSGANLAVNCTTTLYKVENLTGKMEINLAGKVAVNNFGKVFKTSPPTSPSLPAYLLPPKTNAETTLTALADYCYKKAYKMSTGTPPGLDDSQACYYVSFELLDKGVSVTPGGVVSGFDKLFPNTRRPGGGVCIGLKPASTDQLTGGPYTNNSAPALFWFNDTGWKLSDYRDANGVLLTDQSKFRHRNKLVLTASPPGIPYNWGKDQAPVAGSDSNCPAVGSDFPTVTPAHPAATDPNWDPDSDDWLMPSIGSLKFRDTGLSTASIYQKCVNTGTKPGTRPYPTGDWNTSVWVKTNGSDIESDQLNYWVYLNPPPSQAERQSLPIAPKNNVGPYTPVLSAAADPFLFDLLLPAASDTYGLNWAGAYGVSKEKEFLVSAESGLNLGTDAERSYVLNSKAEDQDWNASAESNDITLTVKTSPPYVDSLTASVASVVCGQSYTVTCKVSDCDSARSDVTGQLLESKDNGAFNLVGSAANPDSNWDIKYTKTIPTVAGGCGSYVGTYTYKCRVYDEKGTVHQTDSDTVAITPPAVVVTGPEITIYHQGPGESTFTTGPITGYTEDVFSLDVEAKYPDGTVETSITRENTVFSTVPAGAATITQGGAVDKASMSVTYSTCGTNYIGKLKATATAGGSTFNGEVDLTVTPMVMKWMGDCWGYRTTPITFSASSPSEGWCWNASCPNGCDSICSAAPSGDKLGFCGSGDYMSWTVDTSAWVTGKYQIVLDAAGEQAKIDLSQTCYCCSGSKTAYTCTTSSGIPTAKLSATGWTTTTFSYQDTLIEIGEGYTRTTEYLNKDSWNPDASTVVKVEFVNDCCQDWSTTDWIFYDVGIRGAC